MAPISCRPITEERSTRCRGIETRRCTGSRGRLLRKLFCIHAVVQLWDDNRLTYTILSFFVGLISRVLV